ncbi:MAG: pyridoxal-phosphate dependent enzyme, partial [Chloroflexi bacterium]|nr:pyridoxal-phosphate dependent enzyme [Chloroflexota bacterium]
NPRAHYETTGPEILRELPEVDVFIAGLGTGGTLMGTGRRLKEHNPQTRVLAVVPHPGDLVQGLRSLEEGFIPPILDQSLLDGRFVVASKDAFATTRLLMEQESIFAGISSGSVVYAAMRVAQRMERGNIVALLADGGWKYLSTGLWTSAEFESQPGLESKIWW